MSRSRRQPRWLTIALTLLLGFDWIQINESFVIVVRTVGPSAASPSTGAIRSSNVRRRLCLNAKNKPKLTMAQKRKKRAQRLPPTPIDENLPPAKLDSQNPPAVVVPAVSDAAPAAANNDADAKATQTKAQKLLQSQRESVAMLTAVKVAVERLPVDEISDALDRQGYWYSSSNNDALLPTTFVDALQDEGVALLQNSNMTQDLAAGVGSGEFLASLLGGDEQYQISPRSIEWVVSVTKHLPAHLLLNSSNSIPALSSSNCMATMRTLDRRVREASRQLLTGDTSVDDTDDEPGVVTRPFECVVTDPETDRRRLSLYYYIVPEAWDADCGGGLTFETTGETVPAQRNRLVVFRSDRTAVRPQAWKGSSELPHGSCIELHLVQEAS